MATISILVLHGPNLNLLGEREPQHYGKRTLEDIDQVLKTIASAKSIKLETMQNKSYSLINLSSFSDVPLRQQARHVLRALWQGR